jgi:two-component system, cell cycle sensor histidine kinase and response regulator CckA
MAAIGGGKTVLVVDDDDSLRMLCRITLELDGYRVLEAASIEDARTALAAGPVDAILLDLHVGDDDGKQLLTSLGGTRPRVALFTGSEVINPELRELADAVLSKPLGIERLSETVGRLIEGPGGRFAA